MKIKKNNNKILDRPIKIIDKGIKNSNAIDIKPGSAEKTRGRKYESNKVVDNGKSFIGK